MEYFDFGGGAWERMLSLLGEGPISLVSGLFLMLFVLFGAGYLILRSNQRLRTLYVVLFSLYFYFKLSGIYLLLLLFTALSDYIIGKRIYRRREQGQRCRGWLALSVVINVGILAYFTATNFFVDSINAIYGDGTLDWEAVVKPAGVSFFVFQSLAYVIDISRGTIKPLKHLSDYIFLLSFFPKVMCGPLVRAKDFIPQIEAERLVIERKDLGRAVKLLVTGLIKYAVIAKIVGSQFVQPAFDGSLGDSGVVALMAVYGFTLQIYCDFSGISDIAVGIALLMGFRLPDNFDAPYKSATITEFWRRWHISLSSWLRDYLYISLGGNRKGSFRTYLNLFMTMFIGGLWHGVGLCYIIWGALHGLALALHKVWLKLIPNAKRFGEEMHSVWRLPATLLTFHIVAFGWLFFGSALMFPQSDMQVAGDILHRIAHNFSLADVVPMVQSSGFAIATICLGYVLHFLPKRYDRAMCNFTTRSGWLGGALILIVAIWLVMQCDAIMLAQSSDGAATMSALPMYANY